MVMNGILGTVQGILGGLGGGIGPKSAPKSRIPNKSYVQITDGDAAYDTVAEVIALITGVAHANFFKIWQHTVEAQKLMAWGYGSPALPYNQGYMWFASLDLAVDWDVGVLRIAQSNSSEFDMRVIAEFPDDQLHSTTVTTLATSKVLDKNQKIALPEKVEFPLIGEDSKLLLLYALLTAATAHETAGFQIPVTEYY